MEFWSYFHVHWISQRILPNIGTLAVFINIVILAFFYKHWSFDLIFACIIILALSFKTLEFSSFFIIIAIIISYLSKHWNSCFNSPFLYIYWNSYVIFPNIGILILSLETVEFGPHAFQHWNSDLILLKLVFWPCFFKTWNSVLILRNIRIVILFL